MSKAKIEQGVSVALLRNMGAKVGVRHKRFYKVGNETVLIADRDARELGRRDPLPKGGETEIQVSLGDKEIKTVARCSDKDVFNKKTALRVGLTRALLQAQGLQA